MMMRILGVLALVAASTGAGAFSTIAPGNRWSDLSVARLQQLPSAVREALLEAQKACGEESISIRTGFIRYLKDSSGNEFITLHFDQFHCANRSALCASTGCLHQIFVARNGSAPREIWRGHVQEVDLTNESGRASANIACSPYGSYCAAVRLDSRRLAR